MEEILFRKVMLALLSIFLCVLMLAMISTTVFAESYTDLKNEGKPIPVGQDTNIIDSSLEPISPVAVREGQKKSDLAQKVMDIHDRSYSDPISVTKTDLGTIQSYIDEYYKGTPISNFVSSGVSTGKVLPASNPGDYQTLNLWLPGEVQWNDYYCAPASGHAILGGRGISASEGTLASLMYTTSSGTSLGNVAPVLNHYNGSNGNYFHYATLWGPGSYSDSWAVQMTNDAILTLLGHYGVVYDTHQVKGSQYYLQGYYPLQNNNVYHYVAGEGFNSTNPSSRICYYYDSNNQKTNLGNRHMNVTFHCMAVLADDMGIDF